MPGKQSDDEEEGGEEEPADDYHGPIHETSRLRAAARRRWCGCRLLRAWARGWWSGWSPSLIQVRSPDGGNGCWRFGRKIRWVHGCAAHALPPDCAPHHSHILR